MSVDPKWTREALIDLNLSLQMRLGKVEAQLERAQEACDHNYATEWVWVSPLDESAGKIGCCSHCSRVMVSGGVAA